MADSLLNNYNPLYDVHLRQYFALPHMQKHLRKMGLLQGGGRGDEVYERHHAMMDMMLKNREEQLMRMAELRRKLDAAEKVETCRRIRSGLSPESYRRPSKKASRSLSRGRRSAGNERQRRFSNSYEDKDILQKLEQQYTETSPTEVHPRDAYKRLSANVKKFNYLHKMDDGTLINYTDTLKKQLNRLERFREISFGVHSVARQPPTPQTSWFFRRRSLPSLTSSAPANALHEPLRSINNLRGRKHSPQRSNKLNQSHDSRTSCPPSIRKRRESNPRLPPITPNKPKTGKSPSKSAAPRLPPASKPSPSRGRSVARKETRTTVTRTETTTLPSISGKAIASGAAIAAAGVAAAAAIVSSQEPPKDPTPPPVQAVSPVPVASPVQPPSPQPEPAAPSPLPVEEIREQTPREASSPLSTPPREATPPLSTPPREATPPASSPLREATPPPSSPPREATPLREATPPPSTPPALSPPREASPVASPQASPRLDSPAPSHVSHEVSLPSSPVPAQPIPSDSPEPTHEQVEDVEEAFTVQHVDNTQAVEHSEPEDHEESRSVRSVVQQDESDESEPEYAEEDREEELSHPEAITTEDDHHMESHVIPTDDVRDAPASLTVETERHESPEVEEQLSFGVISPEGKASIQQSPTEETSQIEEDIQSEESPEAAVQHSAVVEAVDLPSPVPSPVDEAPVHQEVEPLQVDVQATEHVEHVEASPLHESPAPASPVQHQEVSSPVADAPVSHHESPAASPESIVQETTFTETSVHVEDQRSPVVSERSFHEHEQVEHDLVPSTEVVQAPSPVELDYTASHEAVDYESPVPSPREASPIQASPVASPQEESEPLHVASPAVSPRPAPALMQEKSQRSHEASPAASPHQASSPVSHKDASPPASPQISQHEASLQASPRVASPREASPVEDVTNASPALSPRQESPSFAHEASPIPPAQEASPVASPREASPVQSVKEASPAPSPREASPVPSPRESSPVLSLQETPAAVEDQHQASPAVSPREESVVEEHREPSPTSVQQESFSEPVVQEHHEQYAASPAVSPVAQAASPIPSSPKEASPLASPLQQDSTVIDSEAYEQQELSRPASLSGSIGQASPVAVEAHSPSVDSPVASVVGSEPLVQNSAEAVESPKQSPEANNDSDEEPRHFISHRSSFPTDGFSDEEGNEGDHDHGVTLEITPPEDVKEDDDDDMSTDSMVIHESPSADAMTDSVYVERESGEVVKEETDEEEEEEKPVVTDREWTEGNTHHNEHTEHFETNNGGHFYSHSVTSTTTTTTQGDEANNNSKEDGISSTPGNGNVLAGVAHVEHEADNVSSI